MESEYNRKKQMYDKEAVGLEMQRQELERDCDHFQNECLQEENSYHYLNCLLQLEESRRRRVEDEEKWERGEGFLTPQFKTFSEMFADRIQRQRSLLEQLRKQKVHLSPLAYLVRLLSLRLCLISPSRYSFPVSRTSRTTSPETWSSDECSRT